MATTQVGLNLVYVLGVVAEVGNIARETARIQCLSLVAGIVQILVWPSMRGNAF